MGDSHVWTNQWALSRVRLCDPTDCSLPGSSVPGILQARLLEWVAIPCVWNRFIIGQKAETSSYIFWGLLGKIRVTETSADLFENRRRWRGNDLSLHCFILPTARRLPRTVLWKASFILSAVSLIRIVKSFYHCCCFYSHKQVKGRVP